MHPWKLWKWNLWILIFLNQSLRPKKVIVEIIYKVFLKKKFNLLSPQFFRKWDETSRFCRATISSKWVPFILWDGFVLNFEYLEVKQCQYYSSINFVVATIFLFSTTPAESSYPHFFQDWKLAEMNIENEMCRISLHDVWKLFKLFAELYLYCLKLSYPFLLRTNRPATDSLFAGCTAYRFILALFRWWTMVSV